MVFFFAKKIRKKKGKENEEGKRTYYGDTDIQNLGNWGGLGRLT